MAPNLVAGRVQQIHPVVVRGKVLVEGVGVLVFPGDRQLQRPPAAAGLVAIDVIGFVQDEDRVDGVGCVDGDDLLDRVAINAQRRREHRGHGQRAATRRQGRQVGKIETAAVDDVDTLVANGQVDRVGQGLAGRICQLPTHAVLWCQVHGAAEHVQCVGGLRCQAACRAAAVGSAASTWASRSNACCAS